MQPKDLLKDLEKGDRSELHLWGKKKDEAPPDSLTAALMDSWRQLVNAMPYGSAWVATSDGTVPLTNALGNEVRINQHIGGNIQ